MSETYKTVKAFLQKNSIEVFGALRAEKLNIINKRLMPELTQSAVMFLMPYYVKTPESRNISLYAVSRDYHLFIKELAGAFPSSEGHFFKFFADTSPIDERSAAIDAHLGFVGQNRLVINEKYGSYVFIGTILTDALFDDDEYVTGENTKKCLGCGLCKRECGFLFGRQSYCLSELNQRKRVTDEELKVIRSQPVIWGCDMCQQVCPHNRDIPETPIEFFRKDRLFRIDFRLIQDMSDEEFSRRAYSWRGKGVLLRNLGEDE